jgi:hypothetical protein
MKIFELHEEVLEDYKKYVQSFVSVADDRIRHFIREQVFSSNYLWPDVLIQLNPTYQMGETVDELSARGTVHPIIAEIFRDKKNLPFRLYQHQQAAIEKAKKTGTFRRYQRDWFWKKPLLFYSYCGFYCSTTNRQRSSYRDHRLSNECPG